MIVYQVVKRFLDVVVAGAALIVLTPILIPIVIALRFTGEGEIFYRQKRIGFGNSRFDILKFATMLKDSPNIGTGSLTVRGDPRVTRVGRYLRATKVNELPQLVNVVLGDMGLVGPRPQLEVDHESYPQHVRDAIYQVRPGVTGIGSIVFRDEEALLSAPGVEPRAFYRDQIMPYKGALELWYLDHKSLWTDFRIVVLTVWVVFARDSRRIYRTFKDLPPAPNWLGE